MDTSEAAPRRCYICSDPTADATTMPLCSECRSGLSKNAFGKPIGYEPSDRAAVAPDPDDAWFSVT